MDSEAHCFAPSLWTILLLFVLGSSRFAQSPVHGAESLSILSPSSRRLVQVTVQPPTNTYWVKLSASPDFHEGTNGVCIRIVNTDANLGFMDLDITYPGGVPGGRGMAAGLPLHTNEIRTLVIPTRMAEGGEVPAYATTEWMDRMMFSETGGPDARAVPNSVTKWFEQNSYGHVRITGNVYPQWVTVNSVRYYNDLDYRAPEQIVLDAVGQVQQASPEFFTDKAFDYVILLLPGDLSACYQPYEQLSVPWNDPNGLFRGYLLMDIPVDTNSIYRRPISDEGNSSLDNLRVRTRFNPSSVHGVWLASDPEHAGTNYYTGGSYRLWDNTLTLGTPLPGPNTPVLVSYTPKSFYFVNQANTPFFSTSYAGVWYGAFIHEFAHGLGPHISFSETRFLGDLYQPPAELILDYGAMSGGNHNQAKWDSFTTYSEPCHFEAYTKYVLGFLNPYEVRYGENETHLRLYPTEEYPYTARTKLIKVPLKPAGQASFLRLNSRDYIGDEFLLLELRRKGDVPGIHNFDRGLPQEGLLIFHVLEGYPNGHGYDSYNLVRLVDATPGFTNASPQLDPVLLEQSSLVSSTSPTPFGPASGVFEYLHSEPWQSIATNGASFKYFITAPGPARLYAKFADRRSLPLGTTSTAVQFVWNDNDANGLPDEWEKKYFSAMSSAISEPESDADGDGVSNRDEYFAGTDPTSSASCLRITSQAAAYMLRIDYPVVAGHSYSLEYCTDLTRQRWFRPYPGYETSSRSGTNTYYFNREPSAPARFYRVRMLPD